MCTPRGSLACSPRHNQMMMMMRMKSNSSHRCIQACSQLRMNCSKMTRTHHSSIRKGTRVYSQLRMKMMTRRMKTRTSRCMYIHKYSLACIQDRMKMMRMSCCSKMKTSRCTNIHKYSLACNLDRTTNCSKMKTRTSRCMCSRTGIQACSQGRNPSCHRVFLLLSASQNSCPTRCCSALRSCQKKEEAWLHRESEKP
jgi:hypothetical protein